MSYDVLICDCSSDVCSSFLLFDGVRGSDCLVDKIWVENVELVPLYGLWCWVVVVVVRLVVLVPFVTCSDPFVVSRLARAVFVLPRIFTAIHLHLIALSQRKIGRAHV